MLTHEPNVNQSDVNQETTNADDFSSAHSPVQEKGRNKPKPSKIVPTSTGLRRSTKIRRKPAWMSNEHWQLLHRADMEQGRLVYPVTKLIQSYQTSK